MSQLQDICGCYYTIDQAHRVRRRYLPQVQLRSHTRINPLCFTTQLTQTFINPTSEALPQAKYTFPLYDGVAISAFRCKIGDKIILGHVEEKQQARQTFQAAVSRGENAGLLESLPSSIFLVSLGNIPPRSNVVVYITYAGELKHDAEIDGLRYNLPMSIAPRYGSYPGELAAADTSDAASSAAVERGVDMTIDLDMGDALIEAIDCPVKAYEHLVVISKFSNRTTATATLSLQQAEMDADLVMLVKIVDIGKPRAVLESHARLPGHRAIMTTFVPKFKLPTTKPEIVFIADQSGSMGGAKNTSLVAALSTFLKSLPLDVHFNICAFGSSHKFLFERSEPYVQKNVDQASKFIKTLSAQYGGTNMLDPIEQTFKRHRPEMPLEIILLTDGEIWGEHGLFQFINKQIDQEQIDARVFCLGIGEDVSHSLVEGVARAGRGFSQFVTTSEPMDQKVLRMLKASLYPHLKDCSLDVNYEHEDDGFEVIDDTLAGDEDASDNNPRGLTHDPPTEITVEQREMSLFDEAVGDNDHPISNSDEDLLSRMPTLKSPAILLAPYKLPAMLPYNRTTVYLLLDNSERQPRSITLRATAPQGPLTLEIPIQALDKLDTGIHVLAARKATQELEEGRGWLSDCLLPGTRKLLRDCFACQETFDKIVRTETVRLGVKYQVAGRDTSFVAVGKDIQELKPVQSEELRHSATSITSPAPIDGVPLSDMAYPVPAGLDNFDYESFLNADKSDTGLDLSGWIPQPMPAFRGTGMRSGYSAQVGVSAKRRTSIIHGGAMRFGSGNALPPPPVPKVQASPPSAFSPPAPPKVPGALGSLWSATGSALYSLGGSSGKAQGAQSHEDAIDVCGDHGFDARGAYEEDDEEDPAACDGLCDYDVDSCRLSSTTPSLWVAPSADHDSNIDIAEDATTLHGRGPSASENLATDVSLMTDLERVRSIISLQHFDGRWQWSTELIKLLNVDPSSAEGEKPTGLLGMDRDDKTVTDLVIAFLEDKMKDHEEVWELCVEKARSWIEECRKQ